MLKSFASRRVSVYSELIILAFGGPSLPRSASLLCDLSHRMCFCLVCAILAFGCVAVSSEPTRSFPPEVVILAL